jgi:hypothetical protein
MSRTLQRVNPKIICEVLSVAVAAELQGFLGPLGQLPPPDRRSSARTPQSRGSSSVEPFTVIPRERLRGLAYEARPDG